MSIYTLALHFDKLFIYALSGHKTFPFIQLKGFGLDLLDRFFVAVGRNKGSLRLQQNLLIRTSLSTNSVLGSSYITTIILLSLARTADRHRQLPHSGLELKPFTNLICK